MDSLNLEIDSYSRTDLISLFSLKNNFDERDISTGKEKLTKQLQKAQTLSQDQKINIHMFIDNACVLLSNFIEHDDMDASKQGTWEQEKNNLMINGDGHFVIANANIEEGKKSKVTDGRVSNSDEYTVPPGWINPINVKTITTSMNIDTRFRSLYQTTSSSDFKFDIPDVQKKVTHMSISHIDIPASFYGVSRAMGDSTFVITEKGERSSNNMRTSNELPYAMADALSDDINYTKSTGQWGKEFVQTVLKLHPCFSNIGIVPTIKTLINLHVPNKPVTYKNSGDDWQASTFFINPIFSFGWLVILPDGNYSCEWKNSINSGDLVSSMNTSLTNAIPGILFHTGGVFLAYGFEEYTANLSLDYGISTTNDLKYEVEKSNGKSMFIIPTEGSVFINGTNVTSDLNYPPQEDINYTWSGYKLYFGVNSGGGLDENEHIQLRLGWHLGFRNRDYLCNTTIVCMSEGLAVIIGPRYIFLSIDEGLKNYCNDYVASFSNSSMHENVIAKINMPHSMYNLDVYNFNFERSYFGPGTISKLRIKLLDEYGRVLSLNNMDWSMTVLFNKLYD